MSVSEQVDLFLLGAGVAFPDHLTVQTIESLSVCRCICTNLPAERLSNLPEDIRSKCISLWPLYQDGRIRSENYSDVTEAVLQQAESSLPIAWLTPGHPMIFDSVSKALLKAAQARNWRFTVVPAISSLDTLLAEVAYDPASGLAVYDATGLVRRGISLVPSVALVVLQISVFLSDRAHITLRNTRPDLSPLRDHLLKFFPGEHPCAVVRSSSSITQPPQITWVELNRLADVPVEVLAGASLFVPRLEEHRKIENNGNSGKMA
ncbi:SAM-dependent methyltransferase [Silvibacterium sp.]|uniref:SAM-dependent methyltransferase n=1 Tax=Silvibacterium sp. TaxID=1964179 RepID=UPI0039E6DAF2